MLLTDYIELKKQEAQSIVQVTSARKEINIADNYLLDFFDIFKCKEIDERSKTERYVRDVRDACIKQFKKAEKIHSNHYGGALQHYNEILIYDDLKARVNVVGRTGGGPDYLLSEENEFEVNADLKTVLFTNPKENFIHYQKQKAISQKELDDAKKGIFPAGNKFSPIQTSPFAKCEGDLPEKRKVIIESFIDKTFNQNNYKQLKFEGRDGIQLIDTLVLGFPYFPQDGLREYIHPPLSDYPYWASFSGFLWYTCFGKPGDAVRDFKGLEELSKYGILTNEDQYQQAVIFIIRLGGGRSGKPIYCGFYNSERVKSDILHCLRKTCNFLNDENDSNPLSFSNNPLDNYKPPYLF